MGLRELLASTAAALIIAGCGGPAPSDTRSGAPTAGTSAPAVGLSAPASGLVIDVGIAGGTVTPTNADLQVAVGEPIVIRVDSDVADQLHIHSVPEHTFDVEARSGQSFRFSVDVPGRVAVELHELDRTIATIRVQ